MFGTDFADVNNDGRLDVASNCLAVARAYTSI